MAVNDIVLHGATRFVGQPLADYLARHPKSSRFSWTIAGRNPNKLERIRDSVASQGTEPGAIVAQAADEAPVQAMVADAKVILNVAGPFSQYHGDHTDPYVLAPGTERSHDGETVAGWDSRRFDSKAEAGRFMQFRALD